MIADDRGSAIVCDRMETHSCDRLQSCNRDCRRSQKIEPCSIFCDRLRSSAINCDRAIIPETKVLRSAIKTYPIIFWIPTHDSMLLSNKARVFTCNNRLFVVDMAGIEQGKISNEEFIEEVARYECVYHRYSKDFNYKNKKANCWKEIGEKLNVSVAVAEVLKTVLKSNRRNKFAFSKISSSTSAMLFAAIFPPAQRACNFDTSADRNVCNSWLCDRLRLCTVERCRIRHKIKGKGPEIIIKLNYSRIIPHNPWKWHTKCTTI